MELPWAFASEWLLVAGISYCIVRALRTPYDNITLQVTSSHRLAVDRLAVAGLVVALGFIALNAVVGALRYWGQPAWFGVAAEQLVALHQALTVSSKLIAMPLYAIALSYRAGALRILHALLLLFFALAPAWLPVSQIFTDASIVLALLLLCLHSRWQQAVVTALLLLLAIPLSGLLRLGHEGSIAMLHLLLALHFVAIGRYLAEKRPRE